MLAQNFKKAADLGISEAQFAALRKTLVLAETGRLRHIDPTDYRHDFLGKKSFTGHFNMNWWSMKRTCGTCCCLGGTAELVGNLREDALHVAAQKNPELFNLFYPGRRDRGRDINMKLITPSQAATALRSYLTTGDARWDLAVSP